MDLKIVLLLNKKLEIGVALNAASHLGVGLCGLTTEIARNGPTVGASAECKFNFQNYEDADGNPHPFISALPLIVLRGTSGDIRKCREAFIKANVPFVDYTHCMIGGDYIDQVNRSRATLSSDLEYFGICAVGEKQELDQFTRKYSLWR